MIQLLSWIAFRWVRKQQQTFYKLGEPLSDSEKEVLLPYFSPETLMETRKVVLDRIHPNNFPAKVRLSILKTIFRFQNLAGLTLDNCVFLTGQSASVLSTLFHELIHVTQYEALTPRGFLRSYFQSWQDNGFSYHKISLERVAYGLTHHYETFPGKPFNVKERVLAGMEMK